MRRKINALFNILLLLIVLAAFTNCSKNPGKDAGKLKIGVVLSLSGNGSATGDYTLKGIQLAVKEQNAKGGLLNKQIELDIQDSKGDAATGSGIVSNMLGQTVKPFMICSNTSGVSLAIRPQTEAAKIILVASAATDKLLEDSKYTVRNFIASEQISNEILKYLKDSLQFKSIGIFYANNEFGNSVSNKITQKAKSYNTTQPFTVSYDDKATDFTTLINNQDINAAPAIYVVGLGNSLGTFIKQLREANYKGVIIADPLFNNPEIKAAAGSAAKGVEFIDFAFDAGHPEVKTFLSAYNKAFNSSPQNLAAITYDAVKMIFAAIEKAKSLDYLKIAKPSESKKYNGVTGEIWVNRGDIIYPTVFKMH